MKEREVDEVGEYEKDLAIRSLSAVVSKLSEENEELKKEIANFLSSVPDYWKESMRMQKESESLKVVIERNNAELTNYVGLVARSRDIAVELKKELEDLKAKIRWIKNDARLKELGR